MTIRSSIKNIKIEPTDHVHRKTVEHPRNVTMYVTGLLAVSYMSCLGASKLFVQLLDETFMEIYLTIQQLRIHDRGTVYAERFHVFALPVRKLWNAVPFFHVAYICTSST